MKNNSKTALGIIFILIGVGALLSRITNLNKYFVLILIAAGFFALYFSKGGNKHYGNIGYLIPACAFVAFPVMDYINQNEQSLSGFHDEVSLICLAVAFLVIFLLHTMWFKNVKPGSRNWPAVLCLILLIIAGLNFVSNNYDISIYRYIEDYFWGILLILVGVTILLKEIFKKHL